MPKPQHLNFLNKIKDPSVLLSVVCLLLCNPFTLLAQTSNPLVNGPVKIYYPSGKLQLEGNYKDSVPDGQWTRYSDEQPFNFITTLNYKNGQLHGPYSDELGNGTKVFTGNYLNNKKNGTWNHFAYDGRLLSFANYRNDTLDGPFKEERVSGSYKNGLYHGEVIFLPNEGPYKKVIGHYQNGRRHGLWTYISYHQYRSTLYFINDTANGPYNKYLLASENYSDTLIESGTYKKNQLDGVYTTYGFNHYSPKFRILESKSVVQYKNGVQFGPTVQYYPNDSLMEMRSYDPKTLVSLHCKWDKHGKIIEYVLNRDYFDSGFTCHANGQRKSAFLNGKGLNNRYHKLYNDSGILYSFDSFYYIGKLRYFDHYNYKYGQVVNEYHLINDKRNGRWYDKENQYEWIYKNNVAVSKKGNLSYLNFERYYVEYFDNMDGGDENDIGSENIWGPPTPIVYLYKQEFNKPMFREEKYHLYSDSNACKNLVRDILINDTLHIHGEVIYSVYQSSSGELSEQKLIKGIHPYYDLQILSRLMFKGSSGYMLIPGRRTYVFRF